MLLNSSKKLSQNATDWPFAVVRGIALESFTNENNDIRLKSRRLELVLSVLVHLDNVQRDELIAEIVASVEAGEPRGMVSRQDLNLVIALLSAHTSAEPLVRILEEKFPFESQKEA